MNLRKKLKLKRSYHSFSSTVQNKDFVVELILVLSSLRIFVVYLQIEAASN
jgi:hypothetical protein